MAVIDTYPNPVQAGQDGSLDERAQREYRVAWLVRTDDPKDGPQVVGDAPGLPRLYSTYRFGNDVDLGSTLKSIHPRRVSSEPTLWEVELVYSSRNDTEEFADPNPLARPGKLAWSTEQYQTVAQHDRFGNPIVNTVNDTFDPPVMKDDSRLVLSYVRNEAQNDIPFIFSYENTVNSDMFFGFSPGEVKLTSIQSERHVENNTVYWETAYEFHCRKLLEAPNAIILTPQGNGWTTMPFVLPWNITVLNVGFHELNNGKHMRVTGIDGRPVAQPVRLNQAGKKLAADADRSQSVYVSYQVYDAKTFSFLGIT